MSYRHDDIIYDPEDDVWVPISGFPGYYISETGHVWGPGRYGEGKLLKPTPDRGGHLYVTLVNETGRHRYFVHRLVAETFITNRHNHPMVRHYDDCPWNNTVENLEWGTSRDNVSDAIRNGTAFCLSCRKPIRAINISNGVETTFRSRSEAAKKLGISETLIGRVALGRQTQTNGYMFKELSDDSDYVLNTPHKKTYAKVLAIELSTGIETIFNSQKEAAEALNIGSRMINRVIVGNRPHTHGYTFEYIFDEEVRR